MFRVIRIMIRLIGLIRNFNAKIAIIHYKDREY